MREKIKREWHKWVKLTPTNALYDRALLWLFAGLLMIGFIMVSSASPTVSAGMNILVSLVCFVVCLQISMKKWQEKSGLLFFITIGLLVLVLIIGDSQNGATRWINFKIIKFQPAELAKLVLICYFSSFYMQRLNEIRSSTFSFWKPITVWGVFAILLYQQPDFGSLVVLLILTIAILFIAGAPKKQFVGLGVMSALVGFLAISHSEYRMKRMQSFIDLFNGIFSDYTQIGKALMGFGSGGFWGVGLGNSTQKLGYLSEAHNDFIMAIIAEEMGFLWITIIVLLLVALTIKALVISKQSLKLDNRFGGFFAFGIGVWFFTQGFINLGMASSLLPTKGLTFPFISYGGSSLMIMTIAMAVLIRIDHENRLKYIGHAHLNDD